MRQRIDRELAALFGRNTVERASGIDITRITAAECEAVAAAAKQMRKAKGFPKRQVAIVKTMADNHRLLLCRWLSDPGLDAKKTF